MFALAVLVGVSASTSNGQTNTQSIQVDVPFAFTANKTIHPAGKYRIEPVSDSRLLWRMRGSQKQRVEFMLARSLGENSRGDLRVIFRRYGNKQFLAGFKTSSYEVSLPRSRRENSLRLAQETMAPAEVISLETITGGSR
jgi:hypothetical protein